MPDWSYHTIFKPVLSRLSNSFGREFIHRGMNWISSMPGGTNFIEFLGHMAPSLALRKNLFGLTFSNPIGLSGKIDPFLSGTTAFSHLGFGFIEIGPITRSANKPVNPAHFSKNRDKILFPSPIESIGIEEAFQRLQVLKRLNKPLFIRMSQELSFEELIGILPTLSSYGEAFIIEKYFDPDDFQSLKQIINDKLIFLSIQQSSIYHDLPFIQKINQANCIDGIIIEERNEIVGSDQTFPLKQTKDFIQSIRMLKEHGFDKTPLIISGGVVEPEDAIELMSEGAELLFLSSGYVFSGPGLPKRINEALVDQLDNHQAKISGWIWYWLFGLFITIGGIIALLFSMTTVILPYDEAFLGFTRDEINAINPKFIYFMAHDRMTLAGTMISGGILYMQLARNGVQFGLHWARRAINAAGTVGFLGILLFIGYGYFDWLHGVLWMILLPFFIIGWRKTKRSNRSPFSINRTNHQAWKQSLWGQLCFVVLGFSFILGGFIISLIGATNVFVPTDIGFICMSPEQMNEINNRLIPLIAHDRAGFGSALVSVGLLVLMIALWGYHQGAKWVWNSLLIGGIPAFSAGIVTHFVIGYTTFIHLLPAYIAVFLYLTGLILSKNFLFKTKIK